MRVSSAFALVSYALAVTFPVVAQGGEIIVDRLVSKRSLEGRSPSRLFRRDSGFANGYKQGKCRTYPLTFYHINDVHAHLDEFRSSGSTCTDTTKGCVGGYARVKHLIDQSRPTKKNSLFLNAGDEFQGTLFYTLFKGEKISLTLNQLGFDAMTLGNHEFDDGDDLLADFLHSLNFPVISSNVHSENQKLADGLKPFKIFPEHALALVAVTTETTATISKPSKQTTFEQPATAIKRTIRAIKETYPEIKRFVALTHIGYEEDIALAQASTDISLIIGGHSHTLLGNDTGSKGPYPTIVKNSVGEEVFVVTSYRWGEYLSYIDVEFDGQGRVVKYEGAPIHLTNATSEDPGLKAQVTGWEQAFEQYSKTVLGSTELKLVQATCQTEECTMGDLTADALEDYRSDSVGGIMNAGGMRKEVEAGDITLQDALEVFPFGNSVVQLDFTGAELWDAFEQIVSKQNVKDNTPVTSFVQVSHSIKFTYNPSNPIGSRLITLSIKDDPVDLQKDYRITTIDYLATGGDNFWPARSEFTTLDTIDVVWGNYIKAKTPLKYSTDGRITTTTETTPQKGV